MSTLLSVFHTLGMGSIPQPLFGNLIVFFGFCRRENTVLRANLLPKSVYVIPNAIVADHFHPARSRPDTDMSPYLPLCPVRYQLTCLHTVAVQ